MGLDCWIARSPAGAGDLSDEDAARFAGLDLPLCEWSVHGRFVHFAGKPYLDVVRDVAVIDLGEPWLPPEAMRELARRFEQAHPQGTADAVNAAHPQSPLRLSTDEVVALRILFRTCAEGGLGLASDW